MKGLLKIQVLMLWFITIVMNLNAQVYYEKGTDYNYSNIELFLGVRLTSTSIDESSAVENQIGQRSFGFSFEAEPRLFKYFLIGIEIGGEFGGAVTYTNGAYYAGLSAPLIKKSDFFAFAPTLKYGVHVFNGTLEDENRLMDPMVGAGRFIEPGIDFSLGWLYGYTVRAGTRIYLEDKGVKNYLFLGFGTRLSYLRRYRQ